MHRDDDDQWQNNKQNGHFIYAMAVGRVNSNASKSERGARATDTVFNHSTHAHKHMDRHTRTQTHMYTYTLLCMQCLNTHTHTHTHTPTPTSKPTSTHPHPPTHPPIHPSTHPPTHIHAHTHLRQVQQMPLVRALVRVERHRGARDREILNGQLERQSAHVQFVDRTQDAARR
jgi:hypothetical protein